MTVVSVAAEHRVVLQPIRWGTFVALVNEAEAARGRMTYDRGVLEIMNPLLPHESAKSLLGRMIETFTVLRNIDIRSSASTTFKRDDLQRGFEADESYYVQHVAAIYGKSQIDLSIDPPPDLVVEVDMTHSSIDKLSLFAAMGVPEVWRYDGRRLSIEHLQGHEYRSQGHSRVLTGFPVLLAKELLSMRNDESETAIMRRFADEVNKA